MAFTILCQLNNGCMGCCGHDFISKEKIKEVVEKNSKEFKFRNPQSEEEFIKFRDRTHSTDLHHGVCRNLIDEVVKLLCPLHPHKRRNDLRVGHCNINYMCETAKKFEKWDEEERRKFISFIEEKNLDHLDYSIQMDNDSLLKEFRLHPE